LRCQRRDLPPTAKGAKSAVFGANVAFRSGAPRSMKVGNIASPWRYDFRAGSTVKCANLGEGALFHYAKRAGGGTPK
jgi:hypothetical protein